jgi:hypothetical protein
MALLEGDYKYMIHFDCHTGWFMWWCFTCHQSTLFNISPLVNWLVTEHLSIQGRPDSRWRALLFLVFKQNLNPSSWCIWHTNNCWKWIRNKKVTAPQSTWGQELKINKPPNIINADSQTPKKFLVCCSVVIRVQKWFVELHMALL